MQKLCTLHHRPLSSTFDHSLRRASSTPSRPVHALTDWFPYEKHFLEKLERRHAFQRPLWLAEADVGFAFPTASGWDTVRPKPGARSFRSERLPDTTVEDPHGALFKRYFTAAAYYNVAQLENAEEVIAYHRDRIPKCISRRLGFDPAVQAKLHAHAREHGLHSQFWFTRRTLEKLYGETLYIRSGAAGVDLDICGYDGKPITLFNAGQTTDQKCIERRARRGHMTNFYTCAKFHAGDQCALHSHAEAHGLESNLWIDEGSLRKFEGCAYPSDGARGVELELHRSEVGVFLKFFNLDEIIHKDIVDAAFRESSAVARPRSFRTGAAFTFRVQKALQAAARERKFRSPLWVDAQEMRAFDPPLELTEHDDGVRVDDGRGGRAMYNMDQIKNGKQVVAAYNRRTTAK